jgi:pimeloyl-ACP methyl ester carboxylesterase
MQYWEGWVRNREVRLHFLTNVPALDPGGPIPLVIIPGTAEAAEDYVDLLEALAPRPVFALSLRGRGQSGSPQQGYTLDHHAADIATLIDTLNLPRFCLYGFSRGVTYALAYAAFAPDRVTGLILGDYPALHPALPLSWIEHFMNSESRGIPVSQKMMPHVVEGMQRDSEEIPLWDVLPELACPTLIMYGGQPGARLALEDVQRYLELLPNARVLRFEESDHRLWLPDYGRFIVGIGGFLTRLDSSR